jgi:hypothetical protein
MSYAFGRLPAYPEALAPRLKLGAHLRDAPAPPASVDWYTNVSGWPMYLNDQLGDCTIAMVGHEIGNASAYASGATVILSEQDILAAYERVSGYNPADPNTDQGAVLQDVYGDWRKAGVGGHRALVFAQVDHLNHDQVKTAVQLFGAVGLGIVVRESMMEDFNAGRPWSQWGGAELGGHAVPIVGYDEAFVYVVTWGKVQPMSWSVYAKATDEAWAAVLPEWLNSSGTDPHGVDLHGLGAEFSQLTGEPNPFPDPAPAPPGPPPAPVDPADQVLADATRGWTSHRHHGETGHVAAALRTWAADKGLA